MNAPELRAPPQSIEAEQAVIGGLLLVPDALEAVSGLIGDRDFYRDDHRTIYRAIMRLAGDQRPIDALTVFEKLDADGDADRIGGLSYLTSLVRNTPSAANIEAYAKIVRERALLREMIAVGHSIADHGYSPSGKPADALLDQAESAIMAIAEKRTNTQTGPMRASALLKPVIGRIESASASDGITGLPTGFMDLDKETAGLQAGDLIIVAARPSMGKTTFAMNICENAMMTQDKPVLVFSLEMPAEQLLLRSISSLGSVDFQKVKTGQLDAADWDRVFHATQLIKQRDLLLIDDTAGLTPMTMRARARRAHREHGGLSLIMVDYLQLMQSDGQAENRTNEVSEISRALKALAKELRVPLIALSQLNRSLEQRADKRPVMADLRESGAIEQDADVILCLYRDEVYYPDHADNKGIAEVLIRKQRQGPIGDVKLSFQGRFTRFRNYAPDVGYEYRPAARSESKVSYLTGQPR